MYIRVYDRNLLSCCTPSTMAPHQMTSFIIILLLVVACNGASPQKCSACQKTNIDGPDSVISVDNGMIPSYYNFIQYIFLAIQDVMQVIGRHAQKLSTAVDSTINSTTMAIYGPERMMAAAFGWVLGQVPYMIGCVTYYMPIIGADLESRFHKISKCTIYVAATCDNSFIVEMQSCFTNPNNQIGTLGSDVFDGVDGIFKVASQQLQEMYMCEEMFCMVGTMANTGSSVIMEVIMTVLRIARGGAFSAASMGILVPCIASSIPTNMVKAGTYLSTEMVACLLE